MGEKGKRQVCPRRRGFEMAWSAVAMSESVMLITGHIPPNPTSALLSSVRLELLFSRGELLTEAWDYELCSPFWRLYVNRRAGAEVELDGDRMSLRAESVYLLPAGIRFRTRLAKGARGVWQDFIHFAVEGFPPALLRRLFPAPVTLPEVPEIAA